jgi:SAM-dependent methyltransferase
MENRIEIQKRVSKAKNYTGEILTYFDFFIGKKVVEVGCGFGHMTELLLKNRSVCCVDKSKDFIDAVKKKFCKNPRFSFLLADAASKKFLSIKGKGFDTIICFNVLEHIEDDCIALDNFFSVLPRNGMLLLIVPAFPFLFGTMDKADRHFRRYSKKELLEKLSGSGFIVDRVRYQNFFGIFGWFLNGKILGREIIPINQLLFFDSLVPSLFRIEKIFGPPIGQSIVCVARKP